MRIAFLSASAEPGGAERVLLDLLASLRAAHPEWPLFLVCGADGTLVREAAALGVAAAVLPLPASLASLGDAGVSRGGRIALAARLLRAGPAGVRWLLRLRALLARLAPDVVHTNGFKMHVLGARALPRGARLVWHVHDYVTPRRVMARLMRRAAGRASAALAVSASVAEDLRSAVGPRPPVHVVRNAVDLARFRPEGDRTDLDALSGLSPAPAGTVRVGLVATMGVWKGHAVFLRAIAKLDRRMDVRAYVVGGAIYRTAGSEVRSGDLVRSAEELGIGDRVGFTGFVDEPAAAMRALDIVVHASTQPEPFGLVIAEAMACGRPVVVSAAGGAAELAEGGGALPVPPGDAEAMALAIGRLVSDASLRTSIGSDGRARAMRDFDRARLAAEVGPVYRALVEGG